MDSEQATYPLAYLPIMSRLAHLLLLLPLTYQLVVEAADAPSVTSIAGEEAPSSCDVNGRCKRTMFNIIWSCVSTIICAWPAMYPNILLRESPLKRTLRRIELMFWTVMAPEILSAFALNQRLAAMTIKNVYNHGKGVFVLPLLMNGTIKQSQVTSKRNTNFGKL